MTREENDLAKEVRMLQREVRNLRKEVSELRDFSRYLYLVLTEEGDFSSDDQFTADYSKMNT